MQKQEAGCITYLCKRFLIKGRDESLSPAKLVNFLLYSQSSVSTVLTPDYRVLTNSIIEAMGWMVTSKETAL